MNRLVVVLVAACGGSSLLDSSQKAALDVPKDAIVKPTDNGPVKVAIRVWPAKPTLGDPIYARLEIDAAPGTSVDAPFQEAGLGRFKVVGFTKDAKRNGDGGQHVEQTYTLEAPASGKQRIPPLRLEMIDPAKDSGKPQEILTDEVPLDIAPIPSDAIGAKLHDAVGALDPDVGGTPWTTILLIVSGAAVLASGSLLGYRAWRTRARVQEQRSAYDEAIAKLRALEDKGAPSDAEADAWFVQVSSIVRHYLERRYDIRAPELTTEEFLAVAAQAKQLSAEHRAQLSAFLERCDRVKFAGYRPEAQESIDTLAAARAFVEDTRLLEQAA